MILFNIYANYSIVYCTLPIAIDVSKIDNFDTDGEIITLVKTYTEQLKDFLQKNYNEELILPSVKLNKFRNDIEELNQQQENIIKCQKKLQSILTRKEQNYKNLIEKLSPLQTLVVNLSNFKDIYETIFQNIESNKNEYEEKLAIFKKKNNIEKHAINMQFEDFKKSKSTVELQKSKILKPLSKTVTNLNNLSMEDIDYFINLSEQQKLPEIPNSIILRKISSIKYFVNKKNYKSLDSYSLHLSEEFMDKIGQFYLNQNIHQQKIILETITTITKQHLNTIATLQVVEKNDKYIRSADKLAKNKFISSALIKISKEIKILYTDKEKLQKFIVENDEKSQPMQIKQNTLQKKRNKSPNTQNKEIIVQQGKLKKSQMDAIYTLKQLESALDKKLILKDLMLEVQDLQKRDLIHYTLEKISRQNQQKLYLNQYLYFFTSISQYQNITKLILENMVQETINDNYYYINIKKIERIKELRVKNNIENILEELSLSLTEEDLMSIDSDTPRFELQKQMVKQLDEIILRNHKIFQDNKPIIKMNTSIESNNSSFKKIDLKSNKQVDNFTKDIKKINENMKRQINKPENIEKTPVINIKMNDRGNEITFGKITFKKINPGYLETNNEDNIESHHQKVENIISNKNLTSSDHTNNNKLNKKNQLLKQINYKKIDQQIKKNNFMSEDQQNKKEINIEKQNEKIQTQKLTEEHISKKINYRKTNIKNQKEIKSKIKEYKEQLLCQRKENVDQNSLPSFQEYLNTRLKKNHNNKVGQCEIIKLTKKEFADIKEISERQDKSNKSSFQEINKNNNNQSQLKLTEIICSPIKQDINNNSNTFRSLERSSIDFQKYLSPGPVNNININISNLNQSTDNQSEPIQLMVQPEKLNTINSPKLFLNNNLVKTNLESEYFQKKDINNQNEINIKNLIQDKNKDENHFIIRKTKNFEYESQAQQNQKPIINNDDNNNKESELQVDDIQFAIQPNTQQQSTKSPFNYKQELQNINQPRHFIQFTKGFQEKYKDNKEDKFITFYDSGHQQLKDINNHYYNNKTMSNSNGFTKQNLTTSFNSSNSSKRDELFKQISQSFAEYDTYYNKN